jgi:uncharacterized protein YggE
MIGFTAFALAVVATDMPAQPTITVIGVGSAETPPDIATLSIYINGEGKTPDDASAALQRKQKAIFDGLSALEPDGVTVETGNVSIQGLRSPACKNGSDDDTPILSNGPCAIVGYVVSSSATIRMNSVKDAGTAVGLVGRLGANKAEIDGFALRSSAESKRRATAAAFADARAQATVIAEAGGAKLGAVLVVRDDQSGGGSDIVVTGQLFRRNGAPAPVRIDVVPATVTTVTRLSVTFAIEK